MPFVRIFHPPGVNGRAISDGVHRALVATFGVPEDDRFHVVSEHAPGASLIRPERYLGITYSNHFVAIQITCSDTRGVAQKKALYAAIADNVSRDAGLRRQDILINIVEVRKENWSFGEGEAQYV